MGRNWERQLRYFVIEKWLFEKNNKKVEILVEIETYDSQVFVCYIYSLLYFIILISYKRKIIWKDIKVVEKWDLKRFN